MNNINSSFLKLFNSTSSLSEFEVDILYVFIIPILSIICLLFKIISIHVLKLLIQTNKENNNTLTTNNRSFKRVHFYMITFESSDLLIALVLIFTSIFRCGNYCKLGYDHTTKVFELIFYDLIGGTVLQLEIFLELAIAVERLQTFSINYKQPMKFKFKLIIILVAAIIVPLPNYVLTKTIIPIGILNNETYLYSIKTSHFVQNNKYWTVGLFLYGLLRSSLIYIILLVLNIIIIVKYKHYINKKLKLLLLRQEIITANIKNNNDPRVEIMNKTTRRQLREKDTTDLLIAMSLNFLIGNLPMSCAPIVFMCVGSSRPLIYNYYFIITMIMCILSHMIYFFLFYNYKNAFKMS